MVTVKRQHIWEWTVIIVALVLLGLVAWTILRTTSSAPKKVTTKESTSVTESKKSANSTSADMKSPSSTPSPATTTTAPDPSTLQSLDIQQMGIVVSYDKTLPGISYAIARTPDGTEYVDLMNSELIGDVCTDDQGTFATIIKNPTSSDQATISMTVKVGGDTYGLSLPSADCTNNPDLFAKFQASIKATFPSLAVSTD